MKRIVLSILFLSLVIWYAEWKYAYLRHGIQASNLITKAISKFAEETEKLKKQGKSPESVTLDKGLITEAKAKTLVSLASDYKHLGLKTQLGVTLALNEEVEKAVAEFKSVAAKSPPSSPEYFVSVFNLGFLYANKKEIPNALKYYQLALDAGYERELVQKNIEALWQSGGGGGKGDSKDKKEGEGESKDQDPNENKDKENQKPQNGKPQEKKDLSEQDVQRIMEEIKNQEQKIRAEEQKKGLKGAPNAKDW